MRSRRRDIRLIGGYNQVGFNKTMRRKIVTRIVVAAGILLGVWVTAAHKDFPPDRRRDADQMVAAEFGYGRPVSNAYFKVYGFLQGCTCYYRFDSTADSVQAYVAAKTLVEMPAGTPSVRSFQRGSPYWWSPGRSSTMRYFGWSGPICVLSWDTKTGRCHIKRFGG